MRFLCVLAFCAAVLPLAVYAAEAPFPSRCLYAPGHFGNSYEVMGENEMRAVLDEAKFWGFNRYGDWFDTIDCADPFTDKHFNLGGALWERKKRNFKIAQDLGFKCDLIITPNHVYLDQCKPGLLAKKEGRIFGQLVCPSVPEARQIILTNYENLFRDLADAGVQLSGLSPCPYDYGGCACDACAPWILTFAELSKEIYDIARKYHPDIEAHFIGWWWTPEEHQQFAEWANANAPGWVKSIALHIPYDKTDVGDVVLPKGCERRAFVHIGYADQASPRDVYGHLGPVIAPDRLEKTVHDLAAHGVTGVMAYSEGVFDDVNKALLAGLASGTYDTSDAVLRDYVKRYFGVENKETADKWVAWLRQWARPYEADAATARKVFANLTTNVEGNWRVQQWGRKADLMAINAAIMKTDDPAQQDALIDRFWAKQEEIHRGLWGLGPLRHALARRFAPPPWYKAWAQRQAAEDSAAGSE